MRWVMKSLASAAKLAVSGLILAAATQPAIAVQRDLGAGPVAMRVTPCLIAKASGQQPCPEPALPENNGTASVKIAAYLARAWFFIDLQQLQYAVKEIDAAIALAPNNPKVRHLSARVARSVGDLARAQGDIAIAMKLTPNDPDIRATHAELLEILPAPREALHEFDKIVAERPTHLYSRMKRAQLLLNSGRPVAALRDLDFLVESDEQNADFLAMRGEANLAAGRPQKAVTDLSVALAIEPHQLILVARRALAYEHSGDDAAALKDYEEILGPVGGRPNYAIGGDMLGDLLRGRSRLLVRAGRFDDAATDAIAAVIAGGKPSVLKTQVFLRQHGFPEIPLDGRDSDELRKTLRVCYGLDGCSRQISETL